MRTTPFLIALTALSLVACQNTPDNTPKPTSEVPGSSSASKVSVTMLTTPAPVAGQPTTATPAPVGANAQWVAVQDGNGPWKVLEGTAGAYSFDVTNSAGKYGFAYVCPKPQPPAGSPPQPEDKSSTSS